MLMTFKDYLIFRENQQPQQQGLNVNDWKSSFHDTLRQAQLTPQHAGEEGIVASIDATIYFKWPLNAFNPFPGNTTESSYPFDAQGGVKAAQDVIKYFENKRRPYAQDSNSSWNPKLTPKGNDYFN